MTAKTVIATVTGFLSHHIGDLNNVAVVLSELTAAVPLDAQDKQRIQDAIDTVRNSANNINDFLNGTSVTGGDGGEVTLKESDIVEALANYFNSDAGKAALAAASHSAPSAEGNANG